jgi:hypothetical protein
LLARFYVWPGTPKKCIGWCIGNGKKVRIWRNNWIIGGDMKSTANLTKSGIKSVEKLISQEDQSWKENLV